MVLDTEYHPDKVLSPRNTGLSSSTNVENFGVGINTTGFTEQRGSKQKGGENGITSTKVTPTGVEVTQISPESMGTPKVTKGGKGSTSTASKSKRQKVTQTPRKSRKARNGGTATTATTEAAEGGRDTAVIASLKEK